MKSGEVGTAVAVSSSGLREEKAPPSDGGIEYFKESSIISKVSKP